MRWINTIRKTLGAMRWLVWNIAAILKKKKYRRPPAVFSKWVYFDLDSNPYDRYLHLMFLFFEISGYAVVLPWRIGLLNKWSTHFIVASNPNVFFALRRPREAVATFTNVGDRVDRTDFVLNHDYFNPMANGHFFPMPMVDSFYVYRFHEMTRDYAKNTNRNIGVFFAGRFDAAGYSGNELPDYFRCFNRMTLLHLITEKFRDRLLMTPARNTLENNLTDKIVIFDRIHSNIEPHDLFGILSRSRFFIAFPGVVMPLCHNIIEAMAFGCIPILQYPGLFHPPLEHGVNCLAFEDETSLYEVLTSAVHMEGTKCESMRKQVILYYQTHLDPKAAITNLMSKTGVVKNVFLTGENNSVTLLKQRSPP